MSLFGMEGVRDGGCKLNVTLVWLATDLLEELVNWTFHNNFQQHCRDYASKWLNKSEDYLHEKSSQNDITKFENLR